MFDQLRPVAPQAACCGGFRSRAGAGEVPEVRRPDQADAARLDGPVHHHQHHEAGAGGDGLQRRVLVQADYIAQFAGLESGDLHIAMEMWETTGKQAMEESLATGNTVDLGETGMDAKEEWWYPIYMKEKCPGLPNWKALNDCAEAFSTPETAPKGRYLGGPVTWAGFDDERAEALGLDYEVVHAGTDAALFAELESAYQRKAPDPAAGSTRRTGRRPSTRASGSSSRKYTDECYNDPSLGQQSGHGLRLRQALRLDQEGRLEGRRRTSGPAPMRRPQLPHRQRRNGPDDHRRSTWRASRSMTWSKSWISANESTWQDPVGRLRAVSAMLATVAGLLPRPAPPPR